MISKVWSLISRDWSFLAIVTSIIGLALATVMHVSPPLILLFGILAFSAFDAIGYETVRYIGGENLIGYRICQFAFQWLVSIAVASLVDGLLWVGIGYTLLWWFGVCDWLYYILRKEYGYIKYEDMFWLWWTPLGIINKIVGRKSSGVELTKVSIVVSLCWYLLWVYYAPSQTLTIHDLLRYLGIS